MTSCLAWRIIDFMTTNTVRKQASANSVTTSKRTVSSGVVAERTSGRAAASKTNTVTLQLFSLKGTKMTIVSSPGRVLKATTTSAPGKLVKLDLSRSNLVGKYPAVKHLPAPNSKRKLDDKTRTALLASMVLG